MIEKQYDVNENSLPNSRKVQTPVVVMKNE